MRYNVKPFFIVNLCYINKFKKLVFIIFEKNPFTLKLLPTKYVVLETAGHNMVSDFLTNDCYILVYFGITLLFLQRDTNLVAYLQLPSYNVVY